MDLGFDVVVRVTGIVLVPLILVLLMAIITLEARSSTVRQKEAAAKALPQPAAPAKPAAQCSRPLPRLPRWRRHSR